MFKKIHFIINPAAGQTEPILNTINEALRDVDVDWVVSVTTPKRDAASLTRAAVDDGAELIVSYGGDGTVSSVMNGLVGTDVPLAMLHGGTGNALAYELGISDNLKEAVQCFMGDCEIKTLDLGKVAPDNDPDNAKYFVLRSNVGLHNLLLEQATADLKRQFGNIGYLIAGLRTFSEGNLVPFHLTIDGESFDAEGLTCIIANSAAIGGAARGNVFAPEIHFDDGKLDVFVVDARFESLISMVNSSLGADLSQYPNHWRGETIKIDMDDPSTVTLDGEPFCKTPSTITVVPDAIRVLVPKAEEKETHDS